MGYHSEAAFHQFECDEAHAEFLRNQRRATPWLSQHVVTDDGKVIAQVYGRACPDTWKIIQEQIAERYECEPDDVQSGEDELGDLVVIRGEVVGRFS